MIRFFLAGGASFVVDFGMLWLLHGGLAMWLPLATGLAYAAAFVVNFGLSRSWAFAAQGAGDGQLGRQLPRYIILVVFNLVVTVIGVPGLTWAGLPYLVSKLVTSGVLALINYFVSRFWVFHPGTVTTVAGDRTA